MPSQISTDDQTVKEFVIAGHGNLRKVQEMLQRNPELLNAGYKWGEHDIETAIQAAAQVGSIDVAEFLLSKGAPLEICTAAMLGRRAGVSDMLKSNPDLINEKGAHGIPLLTHAALSGNVELVSELWRLGAKQGASSALHNSISRRRIEVTKWLLDNASPDLSVKNFQGKTLLEVATEMKDEVTVGLLREHEAARS